MVLRPVTAADAAPMAAYRSIPEVCRFVPFEPMTVDDLSSRIDGWRVIDLSADDRVAILVAELPDGQVIGDMMLRVTSTQHGVGALGYVFRPDVSGRGLATEAAHGVLHIAFEHVGLRRMIARVDTENAASARVLARLGMRLEAHRVKAAWFKGRLVDELEYAILRREWVEQHASVPSPVARWCPLEP